MEQMWGCRILSKMGVSQIVDFLSLGCVKNKIVMGMTHAFDPSTPEAGAGGSLSSRAVWSPGHSGRCRKTLSEVADKLQLEVTGT